MYQVSTIIITKTGDPELFHYCAGMTALCKNLSNAALFRIRQNFTARNKTSLTRNEQTVMDEIDAMVTMGYGKPGAVFSYTQLERLMRVTRNPDFFAGLPMQSAQQTLKQVVSDFKAWLASLKAYAKNPSAFTGKPRMPKYRKVEHTAVTITNQDAVLRDGVLKLPLTKLTVRVPHIQKSADLREVKIFPYYGRYMISLTLDVAESALRTDMPCLAGVDFGTDNFAAIVSTDHSSRIYKGGAILSENRLFARERAKAVSVITKGHEHMRADSRHLRHISFKHACFNRDQCHKVSKSIVEYCLEHRCGTLVLGVNRFWKQNSGIGRVNNQKFVQMPIAKLRDIILYKAAVAGITVILQEESYTSKAECSSGDVIPVYGVNDKDASFSGKRICRGLYRCGNGMIVNADCNGAANTLRKAAPDAWHSCDDFSFLAHPEVIGFRLLNPVKPKHIPVKRIEAA